MTKDELRSEISDLEDKIEELEDLLSDALIDKEHFEQQASYLEDALDESQNETYDLEKEYSILENKIEELEERLEDCESPTFGMSISQVSCYEVFMEILESLPVGAHEIEEKLIKMFLNGK